MKTIDDVKFFFSKPENYTDPTLEEERRVGRHILNTHIRQVLRRTIPYYHDDLRLALERFMSFPRLQGVRWLEVVEIKNEVFERVNYSSPKSFASHLRISLRLDVFCRSPQWEGEWQRFTDVVDSLQKPEIIRVIRIREDEVTKLLLRKYKEYAKAHKLGNAENNVSND